MVFVTDIFGEKFKVLDTKKKQQLSCVSPEQSYYMFNLSRSVEDSTASRPEWIDSSRLLIPINTFAGKYHWTLIYIDFIKKQ